MDRGIGTRVTEHPLRDALAGVALFDDHPDRLVVLRLDAGRVEHREREESKREYERLTRAIEHIANGEAAGDGVAPA